ncbi:MAG TPA: hypothetical protein VKU41_24235, partial [Polyangiaceae bacterium]|nr:hypothetical protein [Polyangiaceae bacterium]
TQAGSPFVQSVFDVNGQANSQGVQAYMPYGGAYIEAMKAHGGWVTSPVDLLRFQVNLDGRNNPGSALLNTTLPWLSGLDAGNAVSSAQMFDSGAGGNILTTFPFGTGNINANNYYGDGWFIQNGGPVPGQNWTHTGALPGIYTEQWHLANGMGWAAFFNIDGGATNGSGQTFAQQIQLALQNAFAASNGAWFTQFNGGDLFDQYGVYSSWMSDSQYQATVATQQANGKYPARVEARNIAGTPMFRAYFAPIEGRVWQSFENLDCFSFALATAELAPQGYQITSADSYLGIDGLRKYQVTFVQEM